MFQRLLAFLGYGSPDDIVDFVMTGIAVAPIVVFAGSDIENAILVLFLCLGPMLLVFPWAQAEHEARQAKEAARRALRRQITGKDD